MIEQEREEGAIETLLCEFELGRIPRAATVLPTLLFSSNIVDIAKIYRDGAEVVSLGQRR